MGTKVVECLDWIAPSRPGELLKYAEAFRKENVNLEALWAYRSHKNEPKIAAIAQKPARLRAVLKKLGRKTHVSRCLLMTGKDKTGALVGVLGKLAKAGINLECADALAGGGQFAAAFWVRDGDVARVKKILRAR